MTQKDNILQELTELNSTLGTTVGKNPYSVPAGYFDTLLAGTMDLIRARHARNIAEESGVLSSKLDDLTKKMPYTVPAGYFEALAANTLFNIRKGNDQQNPGEELALLSPLLGGLNKQIPYSVPTGYFESLGKEERPAAKVISITRRNWFRYAAAAVVAVFIVVAGLIYLGGEKTPGGKALAKFTRDVKKMDETQKDDLIDFIDAGMSGEETVKVNTDKSNEVKELLQGVSDQELNDLQEQTEDIQDVLMTN